MEMTVTSTIKYYNLFITLRFTSCCNSICHIKKCNKESQIIFVCVTYCVDFDAKCNDAKCNKWSLLHLAYFLYYIVFCVDMPPCFIHYLARAWCWCPERSLQSAAVTRTASGKPSDQWRSSPRGDRAARTRLESGYTA